LFLTLIGPKKLTMKKYILKIPQPNLPNPQGVEAETFLAPPPPPDGNIIGLDCHPDTFTAAVFVGQTPHDARKLTSKENLSMQALLDWAKAELTPKDIILLEAGSNSFEVCRRLGKQGLRACVLESCHVGKHAKTYADNDKMATARIALVYLAGNAPCVWVPDEQSRERRELTPTARPSATTPLRPIRSKPTLTDAASALASASRRMRKPGNGFSISNLGPSFKPQ
jgi:hypothetical protein